MTHHHPQPETLISYASGALPGAIAGTVACHISLCPECAANVRRLTLLGGLLLERLAPSAISETAAERTAGALPAAFLAAQSEEPAPPPDAPDAILPLPLTRYLGMRLADIPWKQVVKGVRQYWVKLPKGGGQMRLLRLDPGKVLLKHTHRGMELTLVLKGGYGDHSGAFYRGDVIEWSEGTTHRPQVFGEEECICLVASEATPRYSRLMARLLRPILGF